MRESERASLDYAIRRTHFDGLDLIPANLRLFQSEYELAARMARGQGVYELEGPMTSKQVRHRCLTYLDGVCGEIEVDIRRMWPSHLGRLRKEGHA